MYVVTEFNSVVWPNVSTKLLYMQEQQTDFLRKTEKKFKCLPVKIQPNT